MLITVERSSLSDPQEQKQFKKLLTAYMCDQMGFGYRPGRELIEKALGGVREHATSSVYFASKDSNCVGMAVCFEVYSTFLASPVLNIHDLIVLPEFRRLGVAREMLKSIEKDALSRGILKLTLEVRSDNFAAQDLYRSKGFRECSPAMYFWVKYLEKC